MPEGTYTMLKPKNGTPIWEDYTPNAGAYYYVFGTANSVAKYKKASATIILPTDCKLKGTGNGRNAYISFGVEGGAHSLDIGIRNRTLPETVGNAYHVGDDDDGFGWEPYCIECPPDESDHLYPNNRAPVGTTKAKVEVVPDLISKRNIQFTVQWLGASNRVLGTFSENIQLVRTYNWNNFYRFASLVSNDENAPRNDSTYLLGGGFDAVKLGSSNWGISTNLVFKAWIINHPKCQLPYGYWDTCEEFKIDHWA